MVGTQPSAVRRRTATWSPGVHDLVTTVHGRPRSYRLHVPAIDRTDGCPLLVALHHGRADATGIERLTGIVPRASREGFVVLLPEADREHGYWNDGRLSGIDDEGFIARLIDEIGDSLALDERRVFLLGFSNGASMAFLFALRRPIVAAVAAVAGTIGRRPARLSRAVVPVPVVYFHGTRDPFVYYHTGGSAGTRRGVSLSAEELVHWWSRCNGCPAGPVVEALADHVGDGMPVLRTSYGGGSRSTEVVLYTILGGGHTWPGGAQQWAPAGVAGRTSRQVDATGIAFDFFKSRPPRRPHGPGE